MKVGSHACIIEVINIFCVDCNTLIEQSSQYALKISIPSQVIKAKLEFLKHQNNKKMIMSALICDRILENQPLCHI